MSLIVMKFGGTSISNLEKIKNISNRIKRELKKKKKVFVVVSAMGKTTNQLIKKFFAVKKDIFNAEYDSVNDLIYVTGRGTGVNYNPLGETYTLANPESVGAFFASYNAQGIMQSVHLFANSSVNRVEEQM